MKKLFLLLLGIVFLHAQLLAQSRQVTGKVTDDGGNPVANASVLIKGTKIGTFTNENGEFIFSVPPTAKTLVVSAVGYQEYYVSIGSKSIVNVELISDNKKLDEVVVTGYSVQKRIKSTISVSNVKGETINNVALPDINQMLQGNASGVIATANSGQPGAGTDVRIRGITSISASSSPLYVIDGSIVTTGDLTSNTPTQDVISNLNASDVESINILKDAAATALYGARGANGVIVITTKSGKAGQNKFSFNAKYGVGSIAGNIKMMNSTQLLSYERMLMKNAGMTDDQISQRRPDYLANVNTNWYDMAFQSTQTQNYNLAASGGNDKTKYYTSGEYFDQKGSVVGTSFKRYGVRLNLDHKFSKAFDFSAKMNSSYTNQFNAGNGNTYSSPLLQAFFNKPYIPYQDSDGKISDGFSAGEPGTSSYAPFSSIPSTYRPTLVGGNFMHTIERNYIRNNNLLNNINLSFGWNIIEGLRFTVKGVAEMINIEEKQWRAPDSYDGRNYDGLLENTNDKNLNLYTNQILSYTKTIGTGHNLSVTAVNEFQKNKYNFVYVATEGFPNNDLQEPAVASKPLSADGYSSEWASHGMLLQANYDYNAKYFFGASIRRDGSSRFPRDNRYGTFYSLSAAWKLDQEKFMKQITWVNELKLRASYGLTGNTSGLGSNRQKSDYPYQGLYAFSATYNNEPAPYPTQVANPMLTWEKTRSLDMGVDFAVLDNRLRGSLEYYEKRSEALLLERPISMTTGFSKINQNVGKLSNKGIEITLGATAMKRKDFSWNIDANISTLKNKVLSLPNGDSIAAGNQRIAQGRSLGSWYMYEWAGVDPETGAPTWYDANRKKTSVLSSATRYFVGCALPKYTGGITNSFAYKGISLAFLVTFSGGNQVFNSNRRYIESDGATTGYNFTTDVVNNVWQKPGDIADRPKAVWANKSSSNTTSSRFLEDVSYVRLRNVELGYNLPKTILSKIKFDNLRIYSRAENLVTLTKYKGYDPDVSIAPIAPTSTASANSANAGQDFFRYPTSRIITFGITAGF